MSRIIKRREVSYHTEHRLMFDRVELPGSGYSFPCDEKGTVDMEALHPNGRESYAECLKGQVGSSKMEPGRIESYETRHVEPGTIECDCGAHLDNHGGFTITCYRCEADYNGAGQRLAHRSQWGEETGESWQDCYSGSMED
jgi:hypothetical protein